MKENDQLQLTNGKGILFTCNIINADKRGCKVEIINAEVYAQLTRKISIGISLLKNVSRLEWFLEKATEIGVQRIIPLICERTEKQNFRFERMNNIIISAMLQSQQTWLPELLQPKKIHEIITEEFAGLKLIAHCLNDEKGLVTDVVQQNSGTLILIGPEGDFSADEISFAIKHSYKPVTLGSNRLRSETAGIVAATLLSI